MRPCLGGSDGMGLGRRRRGKRPLLSRGKAYKRKAPHQVERFFIVATEVLILLQKRQLLLQLALQLQLLGLPLQELLPLALQPEVLHLQEHPFRGPCL